MAALLSACRPDPPWYLLENATGRDGTIDFGPNPYERGRSWHPSEKFVVAVGGCDYHYLLPLRSMTDSSAHMQVRDDMRIYIDSTGGGGFTSSKKVATQPPGWPISPASKTCG